MLNKKAIAATAAGVETDEDFNQTVLLLHGDGTNGAQNNTFTDSSTNNFTITRNGNTTQGTFSPFSPTGWSNYFDGSGDYLSVANNSAFDFGTGNFTVEFWLNFQNSSGAQTVFDINYTTASNLLFQASSGAMAVYMNGASTILSTSAVSNGTWNHFALVRNGTTVTLYLNGVSASSATYSGNVGNSSSTVYVGGSTGGGGYSVNGYLSNFRVVKGTAVYTSAFTPPTAALTAITNTSLLTCQSNRFKDNSANAFTITANGNASVQAFSPFAPTAAYSAATNGGSGYFDSTGDYLTVSGLTFNPRTSSYTIEGWVYKSVADDGIFVGSATTGGFYIYFDSAANLYVGDTITNTFAGVTPPTTLLYRWGYIALSFDGTTYRLYVDGSLLASSTTLLASSTVTFAAGAYDNGAISLGGYISGLQYSNTAKYTGSTMTIPTAPPTAGASTQLLCNFTNAGIIDSTAKNVLETVGNAQIDTGTKKFGTGSLEFDGTGDWLVGYQNVLYNMGNGDFTVEFWAKTTTTSSGSCFVGATSGGGPANTQWGIFQGYASSTSIDIYLSDGSSYFAYTGGGNVTDGNWHHVAFARSGSSGKLFLDGTQVGSTLSLSTTSLAPSNKPIYIGSQGGDYPFNGFLDDLRITKGVARYTANFTAPTKAFPDQ